MVDPSIKLPTAESMQLKLIKNPKLVSELSNWSKNKAIKVCAFKLTNTSDLEKRIHAVEKLISQTHIDFVAHNDLSEICSQHHGFNLYSSIQDFTSCSNANELCKAIELNLEKNV
jgi:phosphopantothenoylcysteine decarboxylase/phosphopantothenate--cysteine ligase